MRRRCVDRSSTHRTAEGVRSLIDDAIIIPNTPIEDVLDCVNSPQRLAAWFGGVLDVGRGTLTISRPPAKLTISGIDTETIDHCRCVTVAGVIAAGPVRGYVSLRSVACRTETEPQGTALGLGTEIWTHVELPRRTPKPVIGLFSDIIRSGHRHMRAELGT